jgi:chromosome segregation ATPase
MQEKLNDLRAAVSETREKLIEAEAKLADQLAEINAFEFEFEARVGYLLDQLEALEKEIERYNERIRIARNKEIFGRAHISVEDQYRRAWEHPPTDAVRPPAQPLSLTSETDIKQLYRRLARRFHPDLGTNEADRAHRTKKMQLINDAYAARSLTELVALAQEPDIIPTGPMQAGQSEAQLAAALHAELTRCQNRLHQIKKELRSLRFRPSIEMSLEVKSARRQGRDLLAEMAATLQQKIARKTVERDLLKAQFDQLGPEQGFIKIVPRPE